MVLSDRTLKDYIENCYIKISDINPDTQIQCASIDITIGDEYSIMGIPNSSGYTVDMSMPMEYQKRHCGSDGKITIKSKDFILATTNEYIELPDDIAGFVEGRSSVGRLGLFIQNAGWIDPGFKGNITLELFNASNYDLKIKAGMRIGQIVFIKMDTPVDNPYNGKYQGQTGPTGSMIYKDHE